MDKQRLEAYRSNKAEILELTHKLATLAGSESLVGSSVILDCRKGYPQPQSVVGYDYDLEQRRRERWEARIGKLQAEVDEVEAWIEAIPDGLTRRCFRMVAMKVHLSQSVVSEKMSKFLKSDKNDKKV